MRSLVLASASPQRRELLKNIGCLFSVRPSAVDESACGEADPYTRAEQLARLKAQEVALHEEGSYVLGADTLVEAGDGVLLEKPQDAQAARAMLALQSGRASTVHSALCLLAPDGTAYEGVSSSAVHFRVITEADLDWWIGTEAWRDRSGGFQIDGIGQLLIERLEGDWTGVVGLPMYLFGQLCEQAGLPLRDWL